MLQDKHKLRNDENGFASIVIALVLIIVLALITVGFAQLARREQSDALDTQLSSQAFYAAESGINDAYDYIQANVNNPSLGTTIFNNPQNCTTVPGYSPVIDTTNDDSYTCLLVNLTPPNLQFSNIAPESGHNVTFGTSASLNSLTIQWGSANGSNNTFPLSTSFGFPPLATWQTANYLPVVEVSFTPLEDGNTVTRNDLINDSYYVYLYPSKGTGTYSEVSNSTQVPYADSSSPSQEAPIVPGDCQANSTASGFPCSVTITGIPNISGNDYFIHFSDYYEASNLFITGSNSSSGTLNFSGEPLIDSTGKAHNVLKRLQARLALSISGNTSTTQVLPSSAIEAQNLCKRFDTDPASTTFIDTTDDNTPAGSSNDPECVLSP